MAAPGKRPDLYSLEGMEYMFDNKIAPIMRVANEVEAHNPRVAYLCRFYAFEKVHRLDPISSGRGIREFKTGLLQRLERENAPTLKGRVHQSDADEMQDFYLYYYKKYIHTLRNVPDPDPDSVNRDLFTKAHQTTSVLSEVLKAVNVSQSVEVDQAVLDTHNTIEEKKKLYVPYNIRPLDPLSTDQEIMQLPEESATEITNDEKFVKQSTQVKEAVEEEDISDHMFNSKCGNMLDLSLDSEAVSKSGSKPPLPLQYLKDITNNFCDERILGRGGFGVVYKGLLHNGEMVAVKKILQAIPSSRTQFENEVILLMKLKHRNIVRLIGYYYETQHLHMPYEGKSVFAWNTESLLCLECLPNGSLNKYISDASSGLNWHTRFQVIEGISYGLQYLHENSNQPIVHLDLKPANILLDANMLPKITDFGLSRLFDQNQTIHTTITTGTLGYMSPESLRGIITPMSDIFSLGVIIMEVITGHRDYPYDIRKDSVGFIELELQKWRNRLQNEPGYTSLETSCQQIERCIQIGLICVNLERTKRPTMKKIIDMLQGFESMDWYISNELSSHDVQSEP